MKNNKKSVIFSSEIDRLVEKQSSKVGRLKVRKKELLQKMFV